ncbi:hypothetical protein swp_4736 [Shewanella piezotolerans WP3]|uniref:Uncharacterized protein n=1 Tax=Shewanella piezotolerans (strain WP3 / JCM 13877) TaxID=225849 RepID=B8CTX4_SHEPW|nr:hypothetical protein swp_4736 [Shewanella piezotolerans WP3]
MSCQVSTTSNLLVVMIKASQWLAFLLPKIGMVGLSSIAKMH